MIRLPLFNANKQKDVEGELLQALLQAPLPPNNEKLRPVILCSVEEQRRLAFGSFWLRTWVDHALSLIERLLVVALVAFLCFWLVNGYGRDWFYQFQSTAPASGAALATAPNNDAATTRHSPPPFTAMPAPVTDIRESVPTIQLLPFESDTAAVQSATEQETLTDGGSAHPDYLDPQTVLAPPPHTDRRPQRLIMPTIGIDTPVEEVAIQDGVWQVADYAAGYHHGSALPGETGNTVISGHAGLRGAVFRDLASLAVGDDILVEAGGWTYRYRVRQLQSVWPQQVEVMAPTPTEVLTLITCTAWDTQRLVVFADLIDSRPL